MKFKNYQNLKIKHYIKKSSLLLLANSIHRNSKNQVIVKQELKKLKLNYYKTYNKLTIKIFKNSSYKNITKLIYSPVFFLISKQKHVNLSTIKYLENVSFSILGIKLNKKIYSITQIRNLQSYNYNNGISVLYQFLSINLKKIQIISKFYRNNVI